MIHKIWATDTGFKPVEFGLGLNVILAERTQNSGDKDTRNGAGKTTLLNVIHFCLGADLHRLELPRDETEEWSFFLLIDVCGQKITAKRSISNPNIIEVDLAVEGLPFLPEKNPEGGLFYKNTDWKRLLGRCLFDLRDNYTAKYSPSFRGLISYFARRGPDAYTDPFKYFRNQKTYDWQINNAFLLGLNWVHASEAQDVRDRECAAKALENAVKEGLAPSQGELEADRVRIERELSEESKSVSSFRVHPQYEELQTKADELTKEIHRTANELLFVRRKVERYKVSVESEKAPSSSSVEKLYLEAGIHFSESIKKSLDEAKEFHSTIVQNRKLFLETEIVQLDSQLDELETNRRRKTDERAELIELLESHGALAEFSFLQGKVSGKRQELENVKSKISDIREIASRKQEIKTSKIELESMIQRDYEQDRPSWEQAMRLFNDNSLALYEEPGSLIINSTEKGYQLGVEIQKSGSEGVGKMKLFCYDLMLVELMKERKGVDFLFHDSGIFDGVDSRQRALALQLAHKQSMARGFQYICFLNSDMIPSDDFREDFHLDDFVRLRLKDENPANSLLGFHFEVTKKRKPKRK